jgi:hypothetical protein
MTLERELIFNKIPKAQETKPKIDKRDYSKLKPFTLGNNHQSSEITYSMGESICKLYI